MKIRTGFVSNSSSSSFACILPKNFDITKVDFSKYDAMGDNDLEPQDVIKSFEKFLSYGYIEDYDNPAFSVLSEILNPYSIVDWEVSSDDGQILLVDRADIQKVLDLTA